MSNRYQSKQHLDSLTDTALDYDYAEDFGLQSSSSVRFAHYDAYLRSRLPQIVQQNLVNEMEKELRVVDEKLKSMLPTIVRNCLERLCRTYQEGALADEAVPNRNKSLPHDLDIDVSGPAKAANLGAFKVPPEVAPEVSSNLYDEFMASFHREPPDSAYWSREPPPLMHESNYQHSRIGQPCLLTSTDSRPQSLQIDETQTSNLPQFELQNFEHYEKLGNSYAAKGKGKAKDLDASEWWAAGEW